MSGPELFCDADGRWWVAVPVPDDPYGTTHGTRKRRRVPVSPGTDRERAEFVAREAGLLGKEQ